MCFSIDSIKKRITKSDKRSKKMYKNTFFMLLIRGVSIILTLISAPIMLKHVNRVDYGMLLTLTSIVGWVGYMDVGLGNGLRNKLSEYLAQNDLVNAKKIVSSCYAVLFLYVSLIVITFLTVSPNVDWLGVLNAHESNPNEVYQLANIVFISFCFYFLFGLINSILFAYQIPAIQSLFTFIGQLLSFIVLLIQVYIFDVNSVLLIGAANSLIPPFVLLFGSICLFRGKLRNIAPSLKLVEFKSVNKILSLGGKFFILQIITIILFQANSFIITRVSGPEAVVEYNLAFKYISALTIIFNIILAPIWSATTEAYTKKDFAWIKRTLKYVRYVCLGTIILGAFMLLFSNQIYSLWLGENTINIRFSTTLLIFIYITFEMLYKIYGVIINGTGKVLVQMILTGIIALIYVPMAFFLGNKYDLSGVLIANCVVFFLNYLWAKIQCTKILNGQAKGIWAR